MFVKRFLLILLLPVGLLLAACQPAPTAPPLPTPVLIQLQYTPTLGGLLPLVNACARETPGVGIAVIERPASALDLNSAGIALRWGPPSSVPEAAVVAGWDQLAIVVPSGSPLQSISLAQLKAIYAGGERAWNAFLQPGCKTCAPDLASQPLSGKEIHAWAYSSGEDIQEIFAGVLAAPLKPGTTYTAPDSESMRQVVAADPAAIGYLPARLLDNSVRALPVDGVPEGVLRQPILSLSKTEPEGAARQWLACLVDKLKEGYPPHLTKTP